MIREICKDETFLAQKAAPATAADLGVAQDLMETLIAHKYGGKHDRREQTHYRF